MAVQNRVAVIYCITGIEGMINKSLIGNMPPISRDVIDIITVLDRVEI